MPFAMSVYGQLYGGFALMAMICGPVFMLMISKAPRRGTMILFATVKALYIFCIGQVLVGFIFIGGGIICELIVSGDGYRNKMRFGVAYALHNVIYGFGSFFPVILFTDTYRQHLLENGYKKEIVDSMVQAYSNPVVIVTVAISITVFSVIGIVIGSKMLKKHFNPAGVAM